jgi:hypothetical protein
MKTEHARVRFHLGNGPHKGHWQIRNGRRVRYVDPSMASLELRGCRLVNSRRVAGRVHGGEDKTPCAWIECESIKTRPSEAASGELVRYNPRVAPNWIFRGADADGTAFALLRTVGRSVLAC